MQRRFSSTLRIELLREWASSRTLEVSLKWTMNFLIVVIFLWEMVSMRKTLKVLLWTSLQAHPWRKRRRDLKSYLQIMIWPSWGMIMKYRPGTRELCLLLSAKFHQIWKMQQNIPRREIFETVLTTVSIPIHLERT